MFVGMSAATRRFARGACPAPLPGHGVSPHLSQEISYKTGYGCGVPYPRYPCPFPVTWLDRLLPDSVCDGRPYAAGYPYRFGASSLSGGAPFVFRNDSFRHFRTIFSVTGSVGFLYRTSRARYGRRAVFYTGNPPATVRKRLRYVFHALRQTFLLSFLGNNMPVESCSVSGFGSGCLAYFR